jgi:hypothetical protein
MDHSDINQTMRYAKLQPEAGASAVKGLEIWIIQNWIRN